MEEEVFAAMDEFGYQDKENIQQKNTEKGGNKCFARIAVQN